MAKVQVALLALALVVRWFFVYRRGQSIGAVLFKAVQVGKYLPL